MSTRPPTYVGVSGITTAAQAKAILAMWPDTAPPLSLMLGVLTSQKVMSGGERNKRSANPEDFPAIFQADPRALNLVHYFTKEPDTLAGQLLRRGAHLRQLRTWLDPEVCDGVQINVPWPPTEQLVEYRQCAPSMTRVVLQVGPAALGDLSAEAIVSRIASYRGIITDVLFDASGGTGKQWTDPILRWRVLSMLRAWAPDLRLGIAGGLCSATLPDVASLIAEYGLSIDAEGKLRNDRDELDLEEVRAYLDAAASIHGWA